MFPFHTWLPDAHVEAPTAGSVILAGVLLKLGGYGFIRFALPLFPEAAHDLAGIIIVLCLIAIIYGAIVAIVQPDLKKLVAYSSVSHMGFVTLGIFIFQEQGMQGAVLQMVTHGIITGALFLFVGVIYERTHDRTIAKMGGLAARRRSTRRSSASSCWPASACPAWPASSASSWCSSGAFASRPSRRPSPRSSMIFGAVYLLWMYQRVVFGERQRLPEGPRPPPDRHDPVEVLTLAPLVALALVFGVFPALVLDLIQVPVDQHPRPALARRPLRTGCAADDARTSGWPSRRSSSSSAWPCWWSSST